MSLLLAQGELAKAAADVVAAKDVLDMTRACLVVVGLLAVYFFTRWQKAEMANDERMQKQIDTLMGAGTKESTKP